MKRDLIKKVLSTVLTVSIAAVLFAGCGNSQQTAETETESKASEKVLRIAAQPYPLYTPIYVAYELGYIDEELKNAGVEKIFSDVFSGAKNSRPQLDKLLKVIQLIENLIEYRFLISRLRRGSACQR